MTTDRGEGFVRLPNWLINEPGHLTNNEFLVYIVLLHRRNHRTGQCYPGFGEIAKKARLSRSTVKRVIPALERRGIIHVDRSPNRSNVYTVKLPEEAFPAGVTENLGGFRVAPPSAPSDAFLGGSTENPPRVTENPGGFTEEQGVGPQWSPNKTNRTSSTNKTNGQAATVPASAATAPAGFTETTPPPLASDAQLDLLHDLFVHITDQQPPGPQIDAWRKLTVSEAVETIDAWKKQLRHASDYELSDDAYDTLTVTGQAWADAQMVKEDFTPPPDDKIVEEKILKHLQRHGTRTNRQLRDALATAQRNTLKPVLERLIADGVVTATEHFSTPNATRPGLLYQLADNQEIA